MTIIIRTNMLDQSLDKGYWRLSNGYLFRYLFPEFHVNKKVIRAFEQEGFSTIYVPTKKGYGIQMSLENHEEEQDKKTGELSNNELLLIYRLSNVADRIEIKLMMERSSNTSAGTHYLDIITCRAEMVRALRTPNHNQEHDLVKEEYQRLIKKVSPEWLDTINLTQDTFMLGIYNHVFRK